LSLSIFLLVLIWVFVFALSKTLDAAVFIFFEGLGIWVLGYFHTRAVDLTHVRSIRALKRVQYFF